MRHTRQWLAKAHRWGSLALGLLLLVVVISGVVLVLNPEIEQVTHPSLYDTDPGPAKLAPGQALAVVHKELPEFDTAGTFIYDNRGAWEVHSPATGEVARMHRIEWPDDDAVEFHLPQGKMIELLRDCDLTVEELIEIRPPADATTRYPHISLEWARRFPCEEVWRARKAG